MPADPAVPRPTDREGRLAERLAELERKVRQIEALLQGGSTQQVPVVSALPTAGRKGRVVYLSTDNKLYADNGTSWVAQT